MQYSVNIRPVQAVALIFTVRAHPGPALTVKRPNNQNLKTNEKCTICSTVRAGRVTYTNNDLVNPCLN